MEDKKRWFGIPHRYFVLLFIVLGYFAARAYPPLQPHVQLPAESLAHISANFDFTNTLFATLWADVILLLIALKVRSAIKSGSLVPQGIAGAIEAFLEGLYNLTESTAGKWAKKIFPYFATITLLVLVVNWMELIPGVDSIGVFDSHHVHIAGADEHADPFGDHGPCTKTSFLGMALVGGSDSACASAVVPAIRVASTDLNFTAALAVISVVMTQYIGLQALGGSYFKKFWNVSTLFKVPVFGAIDFAVGLLEVVAEFAKILSFSFRLFGNIFAGSVLLFVIGSLVPVFAQSVFLMLEFFVGLIQAIVFGMLTMTFMAQATHSHGDDDHH